MRYLRLSIVGLAALVAVMCFPSSSGITVSAQSLPITKTLAWAPNPASDNVTNYTVTLDGMVIGQPTTTSQSVTFSSEGQHLLALTATNGFGTSPPATMTVNVIIPSTPTALTLK